jgi:hypothetical protein
MVAAESREAAKLRTTSTPRDKGLKLCVKGWFIKFILRFMVFKKYIRLPKLAERTGSRVPKLE